MATVNSLTRTIVIRDFDLNLTELFEAEVGAMFSESCDDLLYGPEPKPGTTFFAVREPLGEPFAQLTFTDAEEMDGRNWCFDVTAIEGGTG